MSEWFNSLGPVEWFGAQFEDPTAASMFRMVLISWGFAALAFVGLDRLGSVLLGRSRPLTQVPPERARGWRWGRETPPDTYSMLPAGTIVQIAPSVSTVPNFDRPSPVAAGMLAETIRVPDPAGPLEDDSFWRLFDEESAPLFGFENGLRLRAGEAPERFNPVTRRIESLVRYQDEGILLWTWSPDSTTIVEGDL